MSKATALRDKIGKVLNKVGASDRTCYMRTYTRLGGDPLLGRPGSVYTQDKAIVPTPAIVALSQQDMIALSGLVQVQMSDLMMIVSSLAITKEDLSNKDLSIVFADDSGAEEEYSIAYYVPAVFGGTAIVYNVLLKSKKR